MVPTGHVWLISPPGPWPRLGTVHICWQECPLQMIWCHRTPGVSLLGDTVARLQGMETALGIGIWMNPRFQIASLPAIGPEGVSKVPSWKQQEK